MKAAAVYRALLSCYPAAFRQEYGGEMLLLFAEQLGDARRTRSPLREAALWIRAGFDVVTIAPREHGHVIQQDLKYTFRTMGAKPGFAIVAILSLALGIGANTAIFSLWNGVLHSSLPVQEPEQLVMLSDPNSSGVSVGSQSGERSLLTYAEFEQLRDHAEGFSSLMASESDLGRWQIRAEGGEWEEARGRLVSGSDFETLGVSPLLGRVFTSSDDRAGAPFAVISYPYWRRRFGGRPDVLGKSITVRNAALSIGGVAPPGFFGETSGQQPDLWVPLEAQPSVLPGRDWLHDTGTDKVMWLHVFGRIRRGVTSAQAEGRANSVFKAGLESYYGAVASPDRKREFLDQRLRVRPAAEGASNVRERLSDPLKVLLAAVGVLLLITCANLANLLLARAAARQREIALRLALGASRGRLVRQLFTESAMLALAGAVAGLAAAWLFHAGLARMIAESDSTFDMGFGLDWKVLGFCMAVTAVAAVLFGGLPAWLGTRADAGASLKGQGRTSTGPAGQLRWGRMLVVVQLALSLPLLVGAGLLTRTLYNLQQADLGYPREGLLVVRVDSQAAGYDKARREILFRELMDQFRKIPGVRAATYSENGIFSGRESGDQIEVEGYTPKGNNDRGSRWDQVGPGYFSTLGIPLLQGREINDRDHAAAPKVCVINEAFAKLFFAGRNPIGMRITTIYGDTRNTHEIVGVAKDARTQCVRGDITPRYYVPVAQPLGEMDGAIFTIRAAGDGASVLASVRQAIRRTDATLPVLSAETVEQRLAVRMAQDRIMARLAAAFGLMAMALAAVGLFGVLSYGIARRQTEIGIRIALGAHPARVTAMILRETSGLVIAGLVLGAGLAFGASRWIASQLYGLAPHDPPTLTFAVVVLVIVALTAAYVPAHRVSRLDPMSALRQE